VEVAKAALAAMASAQQTHFQHLYPDDMALDLKIEVIARALYGAVGINLLPAAAAKLARFEARGYRDLPVCVAKTQNSLSDDPKKLGRPRGFQIVIRDAKVAAGAGFVVAYAGDIMTMPGLPKAPSAEGIDIDCEGNTVGLF
jgi:formate--tetrahydrofolate ligase